MTRHFRCLLIAAFFGILFTASASQLPARGGGGCLEAGTPILTPSGSVPVELLKPGDRVLGLRNGSVSPVTVVDTTQVRTVDIYEITVGDRVLRVTAEHPVAVAAGVFRRAASLRPGDAVLVVEQGRSMSRTVTAVRRIRAGTEAYNLLVDRGGTYLADGIVVHNKGCFLPDTRIRLADGTEVPVSRVRPGDRVLAFTDDGAVVATEVRDVITHEVDEYRIIRTDRMVLQVTEEHPFAVGSGEFRTVESLRPGDSILAWDGSGWSRQRIGSIETVHAGTTVYNLRADAPHTYFANGIAVHNKGGGGCFPAGTMVRTPQGDVPIESLAPGDLVIAIDGRGNQAPARISEVYATTSELVELRTRHGALVTTEEHPLETADGEFLFAGDVVAGDRLLIWTRGLLKRAVVVGVSFPEGEEPVYNLTVEGPHTFFADGFVVHNKGGGGFHSSGSSSRGGSRNDPVGSAVGILFTGVFIVIVVLANRRQRLTGNLDHLFGRRQIEKKSVKTEKLLAFLAKTDPSMAPAALRERAKDTFLLLQGCWQSRDYGPMEPLLMPDLYNDHLGQIRGMIRNHEINIIDGLQVDAIDLVNVRYTMKEDDREFTALITATAQDFYIDDRTKRRLRGDDGPAQFQEFWTFQCRQGAWLLREIEQTAESDILSDDNFFEQFTDKGVDQVYGSEAGTEGPEGPWLEGAIMDKERRIERMIGFLGRTDALWDKRKMLLAARSTFLSVTGAWEAGDPAAVPSDDLFPDLAEHLAGLIARDRENGIRREFRNLAVRKTELLLVKNFTNDRNDEYLVRVRAHAQRRMLRQGTVLHNDGDVTPFEQYLTFGRLDGRWKLKEIVAPESGKEMVEAENIDEGAPPQMIAWYYQHKRPL